MTLKSIALLVSLYAVVATAENPAERKLQAGAAAFRNAAQETTAFMNSLVELMATEKLSQPTMNSFPEAVAIKEVEDRKNAAILEFFIDNQILAGITPLFNEIMEEAACALWEFDSVEYTIGIQALPPYFTIRDIIGVIAGFCLTPSNTFARTGYTVRKDTAQDYDITVDVDQSVTLYQRSLLTSGEVFITGVADADPALFTGSFAWTTVIDGLWPQLHFDLEKQVPVTGWGPVTRTCLVGAPIASTQEVTSRVTDCEFEDLSIILQNSDNLCDTDPSICNGFAEKFCRAVSGEVVVDSILGNSTFINNYVNDQLPVCVATR